MKKLMFILFMSSFILILTLIYKENNLNKSLESFSITKEKNSIENMYLNKWVNKKWLTLGDSITKAGKYQNILKNKLGFSEICNKGINGQTMAHQTKNKSTYDLGKEIDYNDYDLVTIFIGTNDFRYGKKIGKIVTDENYFDETTFTGSYQLLIENILSSNPKIDLVLITPMQRNHDGYDINFKNNKGHKLIEYVEATINLGKLYSLPVLDLYSVSGLTERTLDALTRDGLHPNDMGYDRISEKIFRFLLSI